MWHIERMVCLQYRCTKPCTKKNASCKEDHMCTKMCYEKCGDCMIRVERKRPHCEHTGGMPCHMDPETYQCRRKCNRILPCQHSCPNFCSEKCGDCMIRVERKLPHCEHSGGMPCHMDPATYQCRRKCNRILPCQHPCPNFCSEKCGNCQVKVSSKS